MTEDARYSIFLATAPGLEAALAQEAAARGFAEPRAVAGGVEVAGGWADVWRANLELRGAGRVLVRLGAFRAMHLAQLDKRARKFPWGDVLRRDVPVRVEVTCRKSKIYHAKAAAERVERALVEELGVTLSPEAELVVKVRIEDDLCTISVDSSGVALHRRGHKEFVGKAPMRENLAALFLAECGFDGTGPVVDPMCGSGTFVIEAAEVSAGMQPGRSRRFAFEDLASFDAGAFAAMKRDVTAEGPVRFFGYDRDDGAIRGAQANAERAGVSGVTAFARAAISDLQPPEGPPGLVMVNPPYGARVGNRKLLFSLYGTLGKVLAERFSGWRVGLVTSDAGLAKATGLPWLPQGRAVSFGGLKVHLWRTDALP
jgi:putative N6-adenine-specific DNA methylase